MAAAVILFSSVEAMAADPAVKCESGKNKIAGKYAFCLQKAEAIALKKGASPDYTKCDDKFTSKWASVDAKTVAAGGTCPDGGLDSNTVAGLIQQSSDGVTRLLSGDCPSPGVVVAGYCWVLGGIGGSCNDACAGAGLAYDDATLSYAGSDGAVGDCAQVLGYLTGTGPLFYGGPVGPGGVGCIVHGGTGTWYWDLSSATTAEASEPLIRRACACE